MTQRTFSLVTAVLFSLVALLHAVRILRGWQVTVEGAVMPVWISWIGLAIAAYFAYQGFLLSKSRRNRFPSSDRGIQLAKNLDYAQNSQAPANRRRKLALRPDFNS